MRARIFWLSQRAHKPRNPQPLPHPSLRVLTRCSSVITCEWHFWPTLAQKMARAFVPFVIILRTHARTAAEHQFRFEQAAALSHPTGLAGTIASDRSERETRSVPSTPDLRRLHQPQLNPSPKRPGQNKFQRPPLISNRNPRCRAKRRGRFRAGARRDPAHRIFAGRFRSLPRAKASRQRTV